MSVGKSSII